MIRGNLRRNLHVARWTLVGMVLVVCAAGCISSLSRGSNKVTELPDEEDTGKPVHLIRDVARPFGTQFAVVEGTALVMGLDNTGSDPPQTPEKDQLISDMLTRQVKNPRQLLASPETSLVYIRAVLPPGAQEGDRLDAEIEVPKRSETTSIRGGWLMLTPMRPLAVLDHEIREGHVLAIAEGAIIDRATLEGSDDTALQKSGWVLGGAKVKQSRELGLHLEESDMWTKVVPRVESAINSRFHAYNRGQKVGAAVAKRDTYIQLQSPRNYRHNLTRFMKVTLNIPYRYEMTSRVEYIRKLGSELQSLATSEEASLCLEAIGDDAVPKLLDGLANAESAVQFYASEALAYLNRPDGIKTLSLAAQNDSAFRLRALAALGAIDDMDAHDALVQLMDSDSAETRYGSFSTLRDANPQDPTLGRDSRLRAFSLYLVATPHAPMIHVSRRDRPELVLFDPQQALASEPFVLFSGKQYVVRCDVPGQVDVKRFQPDGTEESRQTGATVAEVVQAMGELQAEYPHVVQILQVAKKSGVLASRLVFDALPRSGLSYSPGEIQLPDDVDGPVDPS